MLKSLYSGVSGMKNIQTKMDVISNNIANVNTTGFKSGRVRFEDMISQTLANAQTNVNAKQVGLGVQVGSIDNVMGGGNLQSTGRDLDFGIENGDNSFFTVSADGEDDEVYYTRDGGFYINPDNELVTASGYHVLGVMSPAKLDENFDITSLEYDEATGISKISIPKTMTDAAGVAQDLDSYSIDGNGLIYGVYNGESYVIGQVSLTNFSNPSGLEKIGGNMYQASNNSGEAQVGAAHQSEYGTIRSGFLEMSNVDLSNEFTEMIVASRAYQANSRSITTSDQMLEELLALKR
ncbi:flagellar hook-basal body complex protein [Jeotgalibaca ciconiae]|uniref:Flagellar hook protein FlgE n=1 Tax=Jeotgalibaca ciconiae TaxID=2496265 RepID=A0A3S9HA99_9LACT|nr:flagellar hook-basal body complex protein [Jeotgalibaca ciconiae]AZP04278.1 flagellar hook-basal body complex protein [Jeotgalibaca ciconiae]HJB23441.1 flagellar hook-basal body complex protein [Candidatus Jeotgalibaca pullicola]